MEYAKTICHNLFIRQPLSNTSVRGMHGTANGPNATALITTDLNPRQNSSTRNKQSTNGSVGKDSVHVAEDLGRLLHILGSGDDNHGRRTCAVRSCCRREPASPWPAHKPLQPAWALMFAKHTPRCFTKSASGRWFVMMTSA